MAFRGILLVAAGFLSLWLATTPASIEPESAKAVVEAQRPAPNFGPVSHMAAPMATWSTARIVGIGPDTPPRAAYLRLRRAGALLMALGLVLGGVAAAAVGFSPGAGPLAALALGSTWVVTAHAMNPWETTWSFPALAGAVAAAALARRTGRALWVVIAGAALALGSWLYLSTLFAVPGVAWLACRAAQRGKRLRLISAFVANVALVAYAGLMVGTWPQYHSLLGPLEQYGDLRSHGLFGAPSLATVGGLAFGWTNSLLPLPAWEGARAWLSHGPYLGVAARLAIALSTTAALVLAVVRGARDAKHRDAAVAAGLLAALGLVAPLLWAATTYLKLWTVCLSAVPLAVAVASAGARAKFSIGGGAALLLLLLVVTRVLPDARRPDLNGSAADALARRHPGGLFVTVGWEDLATELAVAEPVQQVSVMDLALRNNTASSVRDSVVRAGLDSAMQSGCLGGRTIYLVEFTNIDSTRWAPFYGQRLGLSFALVRWLTAGATPDTSVTVSDPEGRVRQVDITQRSCPGA